MSGKPSHSYPPCITPVTPPPPLYTLLYISTLLEVENIAITIYAVVNCYWNLNSLELSVTLWGGFITLLENMIALNQENCKI